MTGRCDWWQLHKHLHQCVNTELHGLHGCACGHRWRSCDVGASNDRETLVYLLLADLRKVATVDDCAGSDAAIDAADHLVSEFVAAEAARCAEGMLWRTLGLS